MLDRVGQWSADKLEMLAKYLHAYAVIMAAQKRPRADGRPPWLDNFQYMDAFVGAATLEFRDRATARYLEGSPIVALNCDPPFDRRWFIEKNRARTRRLRDMLASREDGHRAQVVEGEANASLRALVSQLSRRQRAFAFLDPYGLQVEWATVALLGESRRVDVFINFSLMGLTRNLRRQEPPSEEFRSTIRRVMVDDSWVDSLYMTQPDLFGGSLKSRSSLASAALAERYATDLRTSFSHVSPPVIMRNTRRAPIYALVFASHNQRAVAIMTDIMKTYRN